MALAAALGATVLAACGSRLGLPQEPQQGGNFSGEVAYAVKYLWEDIAPAGDLVLTRGQVLYGVEDSARVRCWFSDTAQQRLNPGRSIPPVAVDGDTLRVPVQLCEGGGNTLWVAYRVPRPTLVQWNIGVTPPVPVDSGLVRDDSIRVFGGIAADPDSGFVFVADAGASRITKYAPSRTGGRGITVLATQGNGDHFVQQPHGLFFRRDSLLVADTGKNWLQVLSADVPRSGRGQIQGPPETPLQLHDPTDVWIDASGAYYVTDVGNSRVLQLSAGGTVKEVVTSFDPQAALYPAAVAATNEEVWVTDPERGRLTIYRINTGGGELP